MNHTWGPQTQPQHAHWLSQQQFSERPDPEWYQHDPARCAPCEALREEDRRRLAGGPLNVTPQATRAARLWGNVTLVQALFTALPLITFLLVFGIVLLMVALWS